MLETLPKNFFLSNVLRRENIACGRNGFQRPVLEVDEKDIGCLPDQFSENIFFKNGKVISFHASLSPLPGEINIRGPGFVVHSYHENDGKLEKESFCIDNSPKYDKVVFSSDLKHCIATKVEKCNFDLSPTKSKLLISIVSFDGSTPAKTNFSPIGNLHKNVCTVKHNMELSLVKYCCLSPKLSYLVVTTREEKDYSDHIDLFEVDLVSKLIQHRRCIFTGSGLRRSTLELGIHFNSDETSFIFKQKCCAEKAFIYFIKTNHLRSLQLGSDSEFCVYTFDRKYGQLFLTLNFLNGILKTMSYKNKALINWNCFSLKDLGVVGSISEFKVCSFGSTKVFLACSNLIFAIDPFKQQCVWKIDLGIENQALSLHVNWSGMELFAVTENGSRKCLKIYHLPREEISLKNLSALVVMQSYSVVNLKKLKLPRLVQHYLGIFEEHTDSFMNH